MLAVTLVGVEARAEAPDWKAWASLLGQWQADAKTPSDPTGGFTLTAELGGHVLVRKSHAEYPKTAKREAQRHDDLMVISRDGEVTRATYWDNEGHVIHYVATVSQSRFVLVSEPVANQPRFRFTYVLTGPKVLTIAFEIAPPDAPDAFKPYLEGTAHRVSP